MAKKIGKYSADYGDLEGIKMTDAAYFAAPGVNKSTLWELRKSPAHYKHLLDNPKPDTKAFLLGRAIHCAILTPDDFDGAFVVAPNIDRRSNAGKAAYAEFEKSAAGRDILAKEESEMIWSIADSVHNDPDAEFLLDHCSTEVCEFWTDPMTGIRCKCKIDAVKHDGDHATIVDIKSCDNATPKAFMRNALDYGYDVQAAHYIRGYKEKHPQIKEVDWFFIAIEKKPPYACCIYKVGQDFIDRGEMQLTWLLDKLHECRTKKKWPGYGIKELTLPGWAEFPDIGE